MTVPGHEDFVTIVTGLPRSGTSMLMRMREAGGINPLSDGRRAADDDNPHGYYEYEPVKDLAHDASFLYRALGQSVKVVSALLEHVPGDLCVRVLFSLRDMEEVIASQRRMLSNRGKPTDPAGDSRMARLFTRHLEEVKAQLESSPAGELMYIDYAATVQDPPLASRKINGFLGGELNETAMAAAVSPPLYRNRGRQGA